MIYWNTRFPQQAPFFLPILFFLSTDRGVGEAYGRQTLKLVKEIPSFWVIKP